MLLAKFKIVNFNILKKYTLVSQACLIFAGRYSYHYVGRLDIMETALYCTLFVFFVYKIYESWIL